MTMIHHHENDVKRFEQWADNYDSSWLQRVFFNPAHQAALALAASAVPQPATVLDVGCGTGKLLRLAQTRWPVAQLIGADPASGMIKQAKRQIPDATFYTAMAEALPLQDASIDLALSTISFHHWQDQAAGIREIARVLRPGGYLLLVDISLPVWFQRVIHHGGFHNRAEMLALFNQAGLQVQTQRKNALRGWIATLGKK